VGDIVLHQWIHRERIRPYRLFATNAAYLYDPDDPMEIYYYYRQRCHTCHQYEYTCMNDGWGDYREGAQPARLLMHNHRGSPARPPYVFTGTADRAHRWDTCGFPEGQFGYGRCRSKEWQATIALGSIALTRAVVTGRHHDHVLISDAYSALHANADQTYAAINNPIMLHAYTYVGNADPIGSAPLDQYDLCLRFQIDLPADAIITVARLMLGRWYPQTASVFVKFYLTDRDNMGSYVLGTGDEADNPRRGNVNGPTRLNVHGGTDNEYEIPVDDGVNDYNGWVTIDSDMIIPLLQAFISRPGYVPGYSMGIIVASDEAKNVTTDNQQTVIAYRADDDLVPTLLISWRESAGVSRPSTPPKLRGWRQLTRTGTPVPEAGVWPEELYGIDAGLLPAAYGGGAGDKIPDAPWAYAYRHVILMPVDPLLSWWNQGEYGDAPYPDDAHRHFALQDCQTYEIPCYLRSTPWRYRSLGDSLWPKVRAGIPAIVGFSSAPAQPGFLPVYALSTGDCVVGGYAYLSVNENTWRVYQGQTAPKRFVWDGDPLKRNWSVTYTAYIRSWFVLDSEFSGICIPPPGELPGTPAGCMFRWNAWYEVEIRARFNADADPNDAVFAAWVNSHAAGFGSTVTPRYVHCNDVLKQCALFNKAMGDQIFPPEECQDVAEYTPSPPELGTVYAPCKHADDGYGWWYAPDWVSEHVKSPLLDFVGAYPELGLYHETKTVRKRNQAGTLTDETYAWAVLAYTTNLPWLLSADQGLPVVNSIHRISFDNINDCENPVSQGTYRVGWADDEMYWSAAIAWNDDAAAVQAALEAAENIKPGEIVVTGDVGGPFDIEYVGMHGVDYPPPELRECTLQSNEPCDYSVLIEVIQHGSGG
jgi:hypothetical protein